MHMLVVNDLKGNNCCRLFMTAVNKRNSCRKYGIPFVCRKL